MSRIGKIPVAVPANVKVAVKDRTVSVEGPKGKLEQTFRPEVEVVFDDESKELRVSTRKEDRQAKALHGLTRALLQNMVVGVTKGYEKRLQVVGVGYLAALQNGILQLRVGFANEVHKKVPAGLTVTCPDQTRIVIQGCDRQQVGQFAAEVRAVRKPEPYKGKGVRFEGEHIKLKPGKSAKA